MFRYWFLFLVFFIPLKGVSQVWTTLPGDNDCGNIIPQVSYCPGSSNSFCLGDSVGFSSNSLGSIDSSFVNWGDGITEVFGSNLPGCVYHKYNFRYDSCVTDGFMKIDITIGFYDTCAIGYSLNFFGTSVYVKFKPHAEFKLLPALVCVDEPLVFDLAKACTNVNTIALETATYTWDMGNGVIINDTTNLGTILPPPPPYDTYTIPGNYNITLTIRNSCDSSVYTQPIVVRPPTIIQPSITADSCAPASFQPVMVASNVQTLQWTASPSGNISNDTIAQPVISIGPAGTYIFTVNATGCCFPPQSNCYWADTLKFNQAPSLYPQINPPSLCNSGDIDPNDFFGFNDPDTVITGITWLFNGGVPNSDTTANPPLINYAAPGTYPISLIITSPCGNDTIVDSLYIYSSPQLNVLSSPLIDCDSIGITFNNLSPPAQSYFWTVPFPGVFVPPSGSASAAPVISYNTPGNYDIIVTANTNAVCNAISDTFSVTLLPGPALQLINIIPDSCTTSTISPLNYFNIGGTVINYNWQFPGGNPVTDTTSNPPSVFYAAPGIYNVTLIASNIQCGSDTLSTSFTISIPPILTVNPDSLIGCGSLTVDFTNTSPAGQTYNWNAPGGLFVTGNSTSYSPSIYYNIPGSFAIDVTAQTPGCPPTGIQNFIVRIVDSPQLNSTLLLPLPDECDSNLLFHWFDYFTLSVSPDDSGYAWNIIHNGNNIYNDTTASPVDFQFTSTGQYIISALTRNNCDTVLIADTFNILSPATVIIPGDTLICRDDGIYILSANPVGGTWHLNGNVAPLTSLQFDPYTANVDTNLFVYTYASGTTCEVKDSFSVVVSGRNVSAGSDIHFCGNEGIINLIGFPTGGIWSGVGITDSISGTVNPDSILSGVSNITYTINDVTSGCISRDSMQVTINSPTTAFTNIVDTACMNLNVGFNNNIPGTTAHWNYGDNPGFIIGNLTNHIYSDSGTYIVTLIIEDLNFCTDTVQDTISILHLPDASFSINSPSICGSLPVIITNSSTFTNYTSYNWAYGNGNISNTYFPDTVYYNQLPGTSGNYIITLQTNNICGSAADSQVVTVNQVPLAFFGLSQGDGCSPDTVDFSNVSQGGGGQYQWFINNSFVSTDSALAPQILTADTVDAVYSVMLLSSNFCGADTFIINVTIHPASVQSFFNINTLEACLNEPVTLTSFSTPGAYIYWDFGDGNTAVGDTVIHSYATSGSFTIKQYAYECGIDSSSRDIKIHALPIASFTAPQVHCSNDTVLFDNTSIADTTFGSIWQFGDGTSSTFTDPLHHYSDSGYYIVSLTVTVATTGCSDSIFQPIYIAKNPDASFYIPNLGGCIHTITPVNNSSGAVSYLWDMGNGITASGFQPVYTYPDTGSFTVVLTAFEENLCSDDTSFSYVNILPAPKALFTPEPYQQTILNPNFSFTNNSTGEGIVSYAWDFDDGTFAFDFEPHHVYADTGTYEVQLIIINSYNCTDSTSGEIKVEPSFVYYVPSAFTPNGDGSNDFFNVQGWFISSAELLIFNRWGEKMFESHDYQKGWDGSIKQKKATPGVYVYILKVFDSAGVEYKKKGVFTLIR